VPTASARSGTTSRDLSRWKSPAAAQVRLEWKFAPGDSFVVERQLTQVQEIEVKDRTFKHENHSTWKVRVAVTDRQRDNGVLTLTLEDVSYEAKGVGNPAAFDDKLAARMKGASFTLTVSPQGTVKKLEGYDAFISKLAEDKPDAERVLRTVFAEEGMEETCAEIFSFLPRKAVRVGDKWTRETVEPVPPFGALQSKLEYQYLGVPVKEPLHVINCTIETTFKKPAAEPDLFRVVKRELQSDEGQASFVFDVRTGRLVSSERSMIVRGNVTVEVNEQRTEMRFVSQNRLKVRVTDK